jgi:hypothetical protein
VHGGSATAAATAGRCLVHLLRHAAVAMAMHVPLTSPSCIHYVAAAPAAPAAWHASAVAFSHHILTQQAAHLLRHAAVAMAMHVTLTPPSCCWNAFSVFSRSASSDPTPAPCRQRHNRTMAQWHSTPVNQAVRHIPSKKSTHQRSRSASSDPAPCSTAAT